MSDKNKNSVPMMEGAPVPKMEKRLTYDGANIPLMQVKSPAPAPAPKNKNKS